MTLTQTRRFDRGAWLTLIGGRRPAAVVAGPGYALRRSCPPMAGPARRWSMEPSRTGPFAAGIPHGDANPALQVGDVVTAINGRELVEDQPPPLPPPWEAGQTVRYTVQRGGETLAVEVSLVQDDPVDLSHLYLPAALGVRHRLAGLVAGGWICLFHATEQSPPLTICSSPARIWLGLSPRFRHGQYCPLCPTAVGHHLVLLLRDRRDLGLRCVVHLVHAGVSHPALADQSLSPEVVPLLSYGLTLGRNYSSCRAIRH